MVLQFSKGTVLDRGFVVLEKRMMDDPFRAREWSWGCVVGNRHTAEQLNSLDNQVVVFGLVVFPILSFKTLCKIPDSASLNELHDNESHAVSGEYLVDLWDMDISLGPLSFQVHPVKRKPLHVSLSLFVGVAGFDKDHGAVEWVSKLAPKAPLTLLDEHMFGENVGIYPRRSVVVSQDGGGRFGEAIEFCMIQGLVNLNAELV